MFPARRVATLGCVTALTVLLAAPRTTAQSRSTLQTIAAGSPQAIRDWDAVTASMLRTGELRVRSRDGDTLVAGRAIDRADQYFRGVRVFGADVARQIDAQGAVVSIFGNIYNGIAISPDPALDEAGVRARVTA